MRGTNSVHASKAPETFAFGDHVIVTDGLSRGKRGTIDQRTRLDIDGHPVWAVQLPMPDGLRCIREDYLAPTEDPS